ncbi:MAG: hypothetical protein AAF226_17180, partial [Verrucomicrobiota bacterium]
MKPLLITIIASVIVALIAGLFGHGCHKTEIEGLLDQRVADSKILEQDKFKNVSIKYDYLTGMATGEVASDEIKDELISNLSEGVIIDGEPLSNGRFDFSQVQVAAAPVKPAPPVVPAKPAPVTPKVEKVPSTLSAVRNNDSLLLTGLVPSQADKNAIADSFKEIKNLEIDNQIKVTDTSKALPDMGHLKAALPAVIGASAMSAFELTKDTITAKGEVPHPKVKDSVMANLAGDKFEGFDLVDEVKVTAAPNP